MRKCDKSHAKSKKKPTFQNKECFRTLRRQVNKEIDKSYATHISKIIGGSLTTNHKRFWSFIKQSCTENMGIHILKVDDKLAFTDLDKAELLNEKFQTIITSEDEPIPSKCTSPYPDTLISSLNKRVSQSNSLELIPQRLLVQMRSQLGSLRKQLKKNYPIITHILQQSYDSGVIPDDWSHALLTEAYRKDSKSDPLNFHPISLTRLCKSMEHMVLSNLWKHLHRYKIIYKFQYGFHSVLLCETQLIEATEDWTKSIEAKKHVDITLLDFSKVFDKVPHHRLIAKLDYYGIRGQTQSWISAFLSNCTQSVSLNGIKSPSKSVTYGVPQGLVLDTVLFLLYFTFAPLCR